MLLPNYNYIYADTNVVSDICKSTELMQKLMKRFPIGESLFCFSTYTLYEINRNDELMKKFQKFYSIFPCALVVSYFPLANREFEFIAGTTEDIDPILLTPQGIKVQGKAMNPKSLEALLSQKVVSDSFANVDNYTDQFYQEMLNIFDSDEFVGVSPETCSRNQFIDRLKKYEFRHRFLAGKKVDTPFDKQKVKIMKSMEVLAQGIYYKFYNDRQRKKSKSDIIDVLIMTTAPYVDTFISEGNCVDIYQKIVRMNKCGIQSNFMTLSELRKVEL